jgi:hypothetical protein
MPSNFEYFKQQLDDAVELLERSDIIEKNTITLPNKLDPLVDTQSLLARCDSLCEKHDDTKPTIRIIHHLACSGGTLFSKCLSAMPNVYLLSELHPFTDLGINKIKPNYAPSDIAALTKYANIPKQKVLAEKIFKNSIDEVYKHVTNIGGFLVLRDHTHADFNTFEDIPEKSVIITLLEESYTIESVLTIRDPLDAYASLVKNNWVHFEPGTFDEYCRRLLLLINNFEHQRIYKFEDFITSPQEQMQSITHALNIPFDEVFEDVFGMFKVTGDSGRSSDVIGDRERQVPSDIMEESSNSLFYETIKSQFKYVI